jgi:hypothetical protein
MGLVERIDVEKCHQRAPDEWLAELSLDLVAR